MSEYMNHYRYYCLAFDRLVDIAFERKRLEVLLIEHTAEEIDYHDRIKALDELERQMNKDKFYNAGQIT